MRIFYYNLQCEAFQVEKGMNFMLAFEKISWPQFLEDWRQKNDDRTDDPSEIYGDIRLPERATAASAGYDFFAPHREFSFRILSPTMTAPRRRAAAALAARTNNRSLSRNNA